SIKAGNKVLNLVPLSAFNPSIGHVAKDTASDVVNEIPKDKTEILKEKPNYNPKGVTHKLPCVDNLKDKVSDTIKGKPKDKPKGVTDKALCFDTIKDKVSDIVKEKPKDKPKGVTDKAPCVHNVKDKVLDIVVKSRVPKDKVSDIVDNVKDKCKTELPKDKAMDKTKSVVKSKVLDVINEKRKTRVMKDKPKDKVPSVVKSKVSTELPKDKTKDKVDLHKDKSKPKVKNNVKSEVPILRSRSKCKPEVKAKAYVRVFKSNENVRRKRILSKENHALIESQKIKTKSELKRKMKGGSDSDSSSLDEEKVMPKEKLARICSKRVFLDDLIRKASSVYPGYVKFIELQERYIQVFRDLISFDVDMSSVDGGNVSNRDDDNDHLNVDDDLNDKEPMTVKESVDPIVQETVVEEIAAKEYEILSTPESYTQWLERNADLVGEMIDSITDEVTYLVTMEVRRLTPDRMATHASEGDKM
nr:hypothetical protein [Tanacetum cinerariifolium]